MKSIHKKILPSIIALVLLVGIVTAPDAWARKKKKKVKIPAEYLPPEGAETVKQFLKTNKLKFKKKLIHVKLAVVQQSSPNPQSIVKLFPVSLDPEGVKAFWASVLIGYRVPSYYSEKIGEIEFEFADKKTFTVFITNDYYYIKHGENDIPFKSMFLTRIIKKYIKTPEHIKARQPSVR
jgi:hypothetical protein